MLCISMKTGDYFTVDENTEVQFQSNNGELVHLMIDAPKEVSILRGQVLERSGGQRPGCVLEPDPRAVKQLPWNGGKKQALAQMRQALERMGDSPEARLLREKLDYIFPAQNG